MRRRRFLQLSGAALGALGLPATGGSAGPSGAAPAVRRGRAADVVVIGAGAFGAWTAWHLMRRGAAVALVDAYGPGNPRSTSGGDTRQIRAGYGERDLYTRWAVRALSEWKRWQEEWAEPLLLSTGRVSLYPAMTESIRAEQRVLDANGVENELFGPDELAYRWPQISPEGIEVAHWEPTAGAIRAARALRTLGSRFGAAGGELRIARAAPGPSSGSRLEAVELTGGERGTLAGGAFVFALGPWLPRMFPSLLGDRISVPRRDVFYWGTPAGDDRFNHPNLPNFSEGSAGHYGFPSIDYHGVKVAPVGGNVQFDPDTDERIVTQYWIKRSRAWVERRFPGLRNQPVIRSRVCQLEDTPDQHFIIDRHPAWENVWLTGGGTGHAFKHGPVLGEYIAQRVLGDETEEAYDRAFRLDRFE